MPPMRPPISPMRPSPPMPPMKPWPAPTSLLQLPEGLPCHAPCLLSGSLYHQLHHNIIQPLENDSGMDGIFTFHATRIAITATCM